MSFKSHRPRRIDSVEEVHECERWRSQVVSEISRKITRINDPILSQYQIRDVNDEINKLMREKTAWEYRIKDLGGPNYLRTKLFQAASLSGQGGYKYYGRAKDLPGVRETLDAAAKERVRKQKLECGEYYEEEEESTENLDAEYFGLGDDSALVREEQEYEASILPGNPGKPIEPIELPKIPTLLEMEAYLVEKQKEQLVQML
ncbi:pre-mRNA-splicing factor Isy1p [Trichomonascus vanleenenianus]|uniref:Isy1p n=1 Tax=Trichomonascus vanleenenianus TaxID=2268995 RepID=UPI003EC9C8FC